MRFTQVLYPVGVIDENGPATGPTEWRREMSLKRIVMVGVIFVIGSVVTLAIMMRFTARLDWDDVFSRPTRVEQGGPDTPPAPPPPPPSAPGSDVGDLAAPVL